MSFSSNIKASDRIPLLQKLLFAAGCNVEHLVSGVTIAILWMPYFNIGCGMNPATLGVILMIIRGWDAFVDPVMGNLSDNARTRWGRRRPFMMVGAIATAAIFPFLWRLPAGATEQGKAIYLVVVGVLFFTSFSAWSMPYYAMQLELTPSYDERTRLMSWITFFTKFAAITSGWVLFVASSSLFANPVTGKPDMPHGVRVCSWFIAGLILCFGLLPPLFVKERPFYTGAALRQKRDPLWQSIRESLSSKPLLRLIAISFFLILGGASQKTLGQYVNIYFVSHGNMPLAYKIEGLKATITLILGICSLPLWVWLSEKFDKHVVVAGLMAGAIFGHLLNIVCLQPSLPYLQILPGVFEGLVIAAIWLLLPAMKGDVADSDEIATFRRREGSLNAFYSWSTKVASTLALGIGGFLLQFSGFDVHVHAQPADVLERMKQTYLFLPVAIWGIAFLFLWGYPLTRRNMNEIRSQLEARRGNL